MDVTQPGVQVWNQWKSISNKNLRSERVNLADMCKWRHLVVKFVTSAIDYVDDGDGDDDVVDDDDADDDNVGEDEDDDDAQLPHWF